ncbi:MAG TPA: DUF929 family protein, partial [Solirubrobacterales bacterium]|nr:DUF929 family protein [Solirubrobacterales bacterium]
PVPASITNAVTSVPPETLDQVGLGKLASRSEFQIKSLGGSASAAGKVHVISLNAAWCPHCAANSWSLAIALSRFGTLGGLRQIDTGTYYEKALEAKPGYSHTKGLSFIDATYKSALVKFEPVVAYDVKGHPLEKPTGAQLSLLKSFDPQGGFPAVAIGEDWGLVGSGYSPGVIAGKSEAAIAKAIAQPSSPIAKAIDGEANVFTAAICTATGDRPEEVCASPAVEKAGKRLPKH